MKPISCSCQSPGGNVICIACAAALTGYSIWTMYKKAEAGELPSVRLSSRHRVYLRDSLTYWLKSHESGDLAA